MESHTTMDRRTVLALLGAGVLSSRLDAMQHNMHTLRERPADYKLAFFTAEQEKLIDRLADLIIPSDERSPGAHAAHVSYYIDLVLANSQADTQTTWQTGLEAFQELAVQKSGKPFLQLGEPDQIAVLGALAPGLKGGQEPAEVFFAGMKKLTVDGYYTSKVGLIDELRYKGNQALASYPGCQHPPGAHE
jgi:hypothetical protein